MRNIEFAAAALNKLEKKTFRFMPMKKKKTTNEEQQDPIALFITSEILPPGNLPYTLARKLSLNLFELIGLGLGKNFQIRARRGVDYLSLDIEKTKFILKDNELHFDRINTITIQKDWTISGVTEVCIGPSGYDSVFFPDKHSILNKIVVKFIPEIINETTPLPARFLEYAFFKTEWIPLLSNDERGIKYRNAFLELEP